MCYQCRQAGNPASHSEHNDWIFGNRGIYFVILFIWVWSFIAISGDVFGVTGVYEWTNTIYGCDVSNYNHKSYGMITNILVNLLIILVTFVSFVAASNNGNFLVSIYEKFPSIPIKLTCA